MKKVINKSKIEGMALMLFLAVEKAQSTLNDQSLNGDQALLTLEKIFSDPELVAGLKDAVEIIEEATPQFKDCRAISKQIESMSWGNDTLIVKFLTGASYEYYQVPATVWQQLLDAKSPGTELNASVKGIYKFAKL